MAKSVMSTGAEAIAGIFVSITALAGVVAKNAAALDRASDASYGYADTYVKNADIRNQGSLKDTLFEEEKRDHERLAERAKFERRKKAFYTDFPELNPDTVSDSSQDEAKPADTKKTKSKD